MEPKRVQETDTRTYAYLIYGEHITEIQWEKESLFNK